MPRQFARRAALLLSVLAMVAMLVGMGAIAAFADPPTYVLTGGSSAHARYLR